MSPRGREPKAPSAVDEWLSAASLRSSPWVRQRIKELRLKGKLVKGWTPPTISDSAIRRMR
jgi:hypothetical protein